jgi:cobalt/nickel transport system permease protein
VFGNRSFIERSLVGTLSFLKESIFTEEYALKNGFLQSLDGRVKLATFLLFIIEVIFTNSMFVLLLFYGLCLMLSRVSNIRLFFFLKRTWIFIPLFTLFMAVPALFDVFSPGEPLVSFAAGSFVCSITRQGLQAASLLVMRVATSVSFAVLLSITTGHFKLLRCLRVFGIPQVFVMTLGMCYRYVYLFVEIIENTYRAIKSRVGVCVHYRRGQHLVAWNIASLWQRSYYLSEEVYRAMLSRGYCGEPRTTGIFKVRGRDIAWSLAAAGFMPLVLFAHRILIK